MPRPLRRLGPSLVPAALLLASASPALGASATVTGDDGSPVALRGSVTIRHMAPEVSFAFAPDEQRYTAQVLGPDGAPASGGTSCTRTSSSFAEAVRYRGNGAYTLVLRVSKDPDDVDCAQAVEQRAVFTIDARTAIRPPGRSPLLTRRPGASSAIDYDVPVALNPGADSHELRYARRARIGPDGGIAGASRRAFVHSGRGTASVTFPRPGRYTMVVRAKVTTPEGERATAWSAPVVVKVVAPFDFSASRLADSSGPSFRFVARIRERSARGRVTVSIARGRRGGGFRRVGRPRIRNGRISVRFTLRRVGDYRIRFSHKGSSTVSAGRVDLPFRLIGVS